MMPVRRAALLLALAIAPVADDTGSAAAQPEPGPTSGVDLDRFVIDVHGEVLDLVQAVEDLQGGTTTLTSEERVTVQLAADVFFAFGSAELSNLARSELDVLAAELRRASGVVRVEGHTDAVGDDASNQALSEQRAIAVAAHLIGAGGTITVEDEGFGEMMPIAPNINPDGSDNSEGRARNRRVEVTYSPPGA